VSGASGYGPGVPANKEDGATRIDLGDAELLVKLRLKHLRPPRFVWTVGPVRDTTPEDRVPADPPTYKKPPGRVDLIMDLQSDKKADFAFGPRDEMGNPTSFDGTIAFTVDDPSIVTLVDNGDGSGNVAAVGAIGSAVLTGTATPNDGSDPIVGTEAINVVAGDTASFAFTFGEQTEVTPDA
jgi:hypothetical protein